MSLLEIRKSVKKQKLQLRKSIDVIEYRQSQISILRNSIANVSTIIKQSKSQETVLFNMVSSDRQIKLLSSLLNNFLKVGELYTIEQLNSINNQIKIITKTEWKRYSLSKWGSNKIALCTEYKSIRPALIFELDSNGFVLKKITYFLSKESVIGL
ncbi:hypothetical protein [Vibrio furnissii]|uniref:hypothetical protein n=1 Tax=Vibrio furnissii TaxID=29494 RepID=UPI001C9BF4E2|nr:hypothetical protein [Vibrio furnissii]MBY7933097.1 hypothetical protein [Vibrio fluvialis]MCG6230245.1 hypothetical protein [Vibrio furnissii]MCG6268444.1 hypothetical protein [Vibrio furnissii]